MNKVIEAILKRGSLRGYKKEDIKEEELNLLLECGMRAPTAGNMMPYSIIVVKDNDTKEKLAKSCDDQPFIKNAPVLLVFVADFNKWYQYYEDNNIRGFLDNQGKAFEAPTEGNLFLAMQDAMLAAQNIVIAGESLGIGSCYIGDIMENLEYHKELFKLPEYVFPVAMLTLGYYPDNYNVQLKDRFEKKYIVFNEEYKSLNKEEIKDMFSERDNLYVKENKYGADNYAQTHFSFKIKSDFMDEMTRSCKEAMKEWDGKIL